MPKKKHSSTKLRYVITNTLCIVSLVTGIVLLMIYQVVHGQEYLEQSFSYTEIGYTVPAARGEILDRYGVPLATNKIGFSLVVQKPLMADSGENPLILSLLELLSAAGKAAVEDIPITKTAPFEFLPEREKDIESIKKTLRLSAYATADDCLAEMQTRFKIARGELSDEQWRDLCCIRADMYAKKFGRFEPYTFAGDVSAETIAKLYEQGDKFAGVIVQESTVRQYVNNSAASHVLGYIGAMNETEYKEYKERGYKLADFVGKSGVEKEFEELLRGQEGRRTITQNAKNEVVKTEDTVVPQPGKTIYLSIDKRLQEEVQKILDSYVAWLKTQKSGRGIKGGAIAVLDPNSGETLALVNYPTYDINEYKTNYSTLANDPLKPLYNRVLSGVYRPGSTFKTVVATAGLNTKDPEGAVISRSSTVNCTHVYNFFAPSSFRPKCTGFHGGISVVNALKVSCNIFFYDVGRRCGIDRIVRYAEGFGLGVDTGLEIPSAVGHVSSPAVKADWVPGDTVQTSIGQSENSFTPLQMASQAMTLATKGTRYKTKLIKKITSYDGRAVFSETLPEVGSTIDAPPEVFDVVTEGMVAAAASTLSSGFYHNNLPYDVAIKSGTPQASANVLNSAAVGFAPAKAPELAIGVMLEEGDWAKYLIRPIMDAWERIKAERAAAAAGTEVQVVS